jgi:hypothetical protein
MSPPFQSDIGEFQQGRLSFLLSILVLLIAAGALFRGYSEPKLSNPAGYDGWEESLGV